MYGAIIGDLAGSIYEYPQINCIKNVMIDDIILDYSFYSDDTILTMAIADAILNGMEYELFLRKYIMKYSNYRPNFEPYFKTTFSPGMINWANSNSMGFSKGNGAMMRISPVGFMFDREEDVIENARLATIPSHNSDEAIDAATKIALIIFYLRKGLSLDEVYNKLDIDLKFRPFSKFNVTCSETINNCLYVLYYSNSFEDAIRKIIYLGGDTDTNACIVGSMGQALYGIDDELIKKVDEKIPDEFRKILKYGKINNLR